MVPGATPSARPPGRWSGRWRLWSVIALLAAITALPVVPGGLPATPAAADTCDGVWVVVDARTLGGSITTRCAPGTPGSGLAALEAAGHRYSFVPRNPGMVCTIDARPDPCNGAPADAYWSYWHAPAGGSWNYSNFGAGNRTPPPGSVEGWRFGDGSAPPGVAPPADEPAPSTDDGGRGSDASSGGDGSAGGATGSRSTDSGGTTDTPSGDGGDSGTDEASSSPGSSSGADTTSSESRDTTADDAADTAADAEDQPGTDGRDEDDQGPATTPGWDPPPVDTGAWANPAEDLTGDPTETDTPGSETQDGEAADGDTDRTPQEAATEPLAAPGDGSNDRQAPVGALAGLGLLAGIGALTYRQRRLRTEVGP